MKIANTSFATWNDIAPDFVVPANVRAAFESQGRGTHAMLFVAGRPRTPLLISDAHGHAEENLLKHPMWSDALAQVRAAVLAPPCVSVVLNRTPCHWGHCLNAKKMGPPRIGCSELLARALELFLLSLGAKANRSTPRFELIATGIYETHGPLENRDGRGPTTNFDLRKLMKAGWRIRALCSNSTPSHRARILAQFVDRIGPSTP